MITGRAATLRHTSMNHMLERPLFSDPSHATLQGVSLLSSMPPSKAKEAYLRRHGLKARANPSPDVETAQPAAAPAVSSPQKRSKTPEPRGSSLCSLPIRHTLSNEDLSARKEPAAFSDLSWAQKRKMHIEARAAGHSQRPVVEAAPPRAAVAPTAVEAKPSLDGEKTWRERRKEAFLVTHNAKPKQTSVGTTVIMFAALLRQRSKGGKTGQTESSLRDTEVDDAPGETSDDVPILAVGEPAKPAAKSWKQKRKESYLARHSPRASTKQAHVAMTAVRFAVKLKHQQRASVDDQDKAEEPAADEEVPVAVGEKAVLCD
ncbi:hypothetical protein AB1Y20_018033 [Prymnesium parvum]|uniref:Ribosome biogenesis protein NOP53 n=1 Tax=Prymnesium parvum TaxID=97485 RepID=A0AB34JQS5_PRYPA